LVSRYRISTDVTVTSTYGETRGALCVFSVSGVDAGLGVSDKVFVNFGENVSNGSVFGIAFLAHPVRKNKTPQANTPISI